MNERDVIVERMRKKEQEVLALEEKLRSSKIYVQALQDVLKAVGKEDAPAEREPKSGSMIAQAREIISQAGEPVHVDELLRQMGKGEAAKASLTGSLAAYVRRAEIFTRPSPNTYGLIELGHDATAAERIEDQPPRGFGAAFEDQDDVPF